MTARRNLNKPRRKKNTTVNLEVFRAERAARARLVISMRRFQRMRAELERFRDLLECEYLAEQRADIDAFKSATAKRAYVLAAAAGGWLTYGQRDALLRGIEKGTK